MFQIFSFLLVKNVVIENENSDNVENIVHDKQKPTKFFSQIRQKTLKNQKISTTINHLLEKTTNYLLKMNKNIFGKFMEGIYKTLELIYKYRKLIMDPL